MGCSVVVLNEFILKINKKTENIAFK